MEFCGHLENYLPIVYVDIENANHPFSYLCEFGKYVYIPSGVAFLSRIKLGYTFQYYLGLPTNPTNSHMQMLPSEKKSRQLFFPIIFSFFGPGFFISLSFGPRGH